MKEHETLIKCTGHEGPESLMLLCLFFPVRAYGKTLTTACLSDMKRLKSAERTLCLFFAVLHCVSSLSSLILFFTPSQPMKVPCELPMLGIICTHHNKEKHPTFVKLALASWTGFLKQVFQQREKEVRSIESQQPTAWVKGETCDPI